VVENVEKIRKVREFHNEKIVQIGTDKPDAQSGRREILTLVDGLVLLSRPGFVTHEEGRRTVALAKAEENKISDRD